MVKFVSLVNNIKCCPKGLETPENKHFKSENKLGRRVAAVGYLGEDRRQFRLCISGQAVKYSRTVYTTKPI